MSSLAAHGICTSHEWRCPPRLHVIISGAQCSPTKYNHDIQYTVLLKIYTPSLAGLVRTILGTVFRVWEASLGNQHLLLQQYVGLEVVKDAKNTEGLGSVQTRTRTRVCCDDVRYQHINVCMYVTGKMLYDRM